MKNFIYIVICLLWLSCANEKKYKSESVEYDMEALSVEEDDISMELKQTNYEDLATQKLTEYFDLLRLKQEHQEFETDILLQLQGFSNDSESINSNEKIDSVKNIRQVGEILKMSDSIQKITLYFDVFSDNNLRMDSILAIITTKSVLLENEMIPTTKIIFKKIK